MMKMRILMRIRIPIPRVVNSKTGIYMFESSHYIYIYNYGAKGVA